MEHSKDYSRCIKDRHRLTRSTLQKNLKAHTEVNAVKTGKKLEYGKSRWDYEKKRALERGAYHFDWNKKDNIEDVLKFHGNIDMDCDYFINTYGDAALDNAVHWATRNKSVGNNYGIDQEVYDIVRSGGDPEGKIYGRANMFQILYNLTMEGLLGLYDYELKLSPSLRTIITYAHGQFCGKA